MTASPSASELECFLLGTLLPAAAARVAEWVATAPEAAETLRGLAPSDTFLDSLKSAARSVATPQTLPAGPAPTVTHVPQLTATPTAFPPTELCGFRVVRELGRGGMGAVFEATDSVLGRKVALKVMLPAVASDPQARARFLREARAAAKVESDYIVPIYQVGEGNGVPFIAMPLLAGETLDARLKSRRPLPLAEVFILGRHMAEGLAAAHAAGLIHRDIKPSNVWLELAPDGMIRRARILDFGLARAPGDAVLTGAGDVLGTPAYMSVEQARGQPVDFRTDLFSLGTVLYEAATGKRAFAGSTAYAILAVLATQTPPAPNAVNPAIPLALSELIVGLMNKTPAGRPQSAQRVAEELARIAAPAPPPVLTPTVVRPVPPPFPTGSASMPALVETDSVIVPPPLPILREPAPATEPLSLDPEPLPPDSEPEPAPPPRRWPLRRLLAIAAAIAAGLLIGGIAVALSGRDRKSQEAAQKPGDPQGNAPVQPGKAEEPFVAPPVVPLTEDQRGLPSDPARKLGVWLHSQGWSQQIGTWEHVNGAWVSGGRPLQPDQALPGGRWAAGHVYLYFDAKRPMTDDDMRHFEDPALRITSLTLSGPSVTDDRFDKLTRLPFAQTIGSISLGDTGITDEGLMFLKPYKKNIMSINLSGANLTHANLTYAGVRKLADAMSPLCVITEPNKYGGAKP